MTVLTKTASPTAARMIKATGVALLLAGVSLGAAHAGTKMGWLWANQQDTVGDYVPDTSYSYNSTGGAITVTGQGGGVYRAHFAGLKTNDTSSVQVTAYGANGYCTVSNWSPEGQAEGITVNCFDAAGVGANAKFTLLYQSHVGNFGTANTGTAYLYADQPSAASYTPNTLYQYNSTGATNTVTRSGTGVYEATLPGFDKVGGHVQVTAYGSTAARCKTSGWSTDGGGTYVGVLCFDAAGAPSDQVFVLSYSRGIPVGWHTNATTSGVYGWASDPKRLHYKLPGAYQFNGFHTGKLTADRFAKGFSAVSIPGTHNYNSSNMLVTAYGSTNAYCTVGGWEPLNVSCYKQGGNSVDAQYDVDFQVDGVVLGPQH